MPKKAIHNLVQRYNTPQANLNDCGRSAQDTLDKISQLKVRPSPVHYTVIFEAIQRVDPYLATEVQKAIDNNSYDDEMAETLFVDLFSQYLYQHLPTDEVESLLNELLVQIQSWVDSTKDKETLVESELAIVTQESQAPSVNKRIEATILPALKSLFSDTQELQKQVNLSAVEIQHLRNELEQAHTIAKTDELTKIPNRRGFNELIDNMVKDAKAESSSFALIILDIDHFKRINDDFGHLIGDSVLRYLAKQLQAETKGKDAIARIGGEEFVVLLPNIEYSNAITLANKLREKIGRNRLNVKSHSKPLKLTISAGVSMYQMGEEIDTLIERADKALYKAKNSGRNKVYGEGAL